MNFYVPFYFVLRSMRVAEYGHVAVKKRRISELKQHFRQNFFHDFQIHHNNSFVKIINL